MHGWMSSQGNFLSLHITRINLCIRKTHIVAYITLNMLTHMQNAEKGKLQCNATIIFLIWFKMKWKRFSPLQCIKKYPCGGWFFIRWDTVLAPVCVHARDNFSSYVYSGDHQIVHEWKLFHVCSNSIFPPEWPN